MTSRPGKAAMFEQFIADGITTMFGNPGTVEQGFLDAAENVEGFRYVLGLQEAAVVGIADGYARATAGPALVQLHTGVGLGNGIGMLYQAMRGHSPLVVVAGEAGLRYDAMEGQMSADLVAMAKPVTKWAARVVHPGSLLRLLRRAVKTAMTPPRGPVFLSLPMDVLDEATDEPAVATTVPSRTVVPTAAELDRAAEALAGAANPVILAGDGVAVSGAQAVLTRLAEILDARVWGVDSSELNIDTTHPLYQGQLGHMFGTSSAAKIGDADAVLVVGTSVFPEVFPALTSPFRADARVVHVDLDDHEIAKNFPVDVGLVADPRATLAELVGRLDHVGTPYVRRDRSLGVPEPARGAPLMDVFCAEVARRRGSPVVVDEALTHSGALNHYLPPRVPGDYFLTRGGSLGIGIPGAVGVALARPGADVLGVTGDGGSMYTFQALWTAAREKAPAKFVVANNSRYALLDENITQYWSERNITPHASPSGFDLSEPAIDFASMSRSLAVSAIRVADAADVPSAVARMFDHDGPFLVDLVTA